MRLRTIGVSVALILTLLVGSLPAEVQKATKVYRIGYLRDGCGIGRNEEVFRQGLRELGYIEGQNIAALRKARTIEPSSLRLSWSS